MNILSESFPVHETIKVIEGITINKNMRWWTAVLLIETYGKRKIAVYSWLNRDGVWRRKMKLIVAGRLQWDNIKQAVEELLNKLEQK